MNSRLTRPLLAVATCAVAFVALLIASHDWAAFGRWDATALDGLRSLSENHRVIWEYNDFWVDSMNLPGVLLVTTLICGAGLMWRRYRQVAAALVIIVGAGLLSQVIKAVASHPRFHGALGDNQLIAAAFPSGHATAAMSLALAAVLVAPSRWRRHAAIGGGAFALSVSIALTIQGWHYPSDVIGGLVVATGVSMLVVAGLRVEEQRRAAPERSSGRGFSDRRLLEIAAAGAGALLALLAVSHLSEVTSFAASHTAAVAAALAIAASLVVLVSGVTAELEAG